MLKISVIICTHNPRPDYLRRVLNALKEQTLPKDQWELLLVDNASQQPLSSVWDLSWHPQGHHFREEALGLTQARLCGISHSKGELLVFVDDDNVLAANYLEVTVELPGQWPIIGAWSGNVHLEFEVPPPPHLELYFPYLCQRHVPQDLWGNNLPAGELPFGAGMGVLRRVAIAYRDQVQNDAARLGLDRRGTALLGGGDQDLALRTRSFGLGTALFAKLSLVHLIPARRLTDDYMVKLVQGSLTSLFIRDALDGKALQSEGRLGRLISALNYWKLTRFERRVHRATKQAQFDADKYLKEYEANSK